MPRSPFRRSARAFAAIGEALEFARAQENDTQARVEDVRTALADVSNAQSEQLAEVDRRLEAIKEQMAAIEASLGRLTRAVAAVEASEAHNRERLYTVRASAAYDEAFSARDPLISVIIPTFDRTDGLTQRSLPSVLNQTHENLDVLVVGDGAPARVREIVDGFKDPRVRYVHLTIRGPYPDDPESAWFIKGSSGSNAGLWEARGEWISFFSDDDVLRPDALASTLSAARDERLEFVYGKTACHMWNGTEETIGAFPPDLGRQGLQGSVLHGALRFLQHNLSAADHQTPNDWSYTERLMRLGVRMGFVDKILCDWYQTPHPRHASDAAGGGAAT
jgi:hypothetical protein